MFDREACGDVDISDEGANAGKVVGIESSGGSGPLGGDGWMIFRSEREAPKSGSTFFAPTGEEDGVVFGKDSDTVFFEEDFSAVVAELAYSENVVFEGGHDLGVADWQVRKC